MFFANYGLLAWLAPLLALPLAIHLLNRKFPRTLRFSSIEQIKKSIARQSRLFRWRHLLLALLRTAALLLLLLAFLKPIREMFGFKPTQRGPRHVLILFDHSLSMEYRDGSLTGRKRGVLEAEKIIDTLGARDLINVRVVGTTTPACFPEFSTDHAEALGFLKAIDVGLGHADFNKATAAAAQDFAKMPGKQEIYYISDFQRQTWADVALDRAPPAARLFFVNVAPNARPNHAIVGARIQEPSATVGETINVEVTVGNFADDAFASEVEVIIDGKRSAKADVSVAPWSVAKVNIPLILGTAGAHTLEARIPEDNLAQDDHFFLSTDVADKEEVLIVSDDRGGKQESAGFFLMKALNPYEHLAGSILPKSVSSSGLSLINTQTTRKIFLTSLERLDSDTCRLLAKFLTDGGSIVYFCDGKMDAENLAHLDKATDGIVPLALGARQDVANIATGVRQISRGDFKSKYLRLFQGAQRQNLALLEFYEYYQATPTGKGKVLLTYADGTPAMASAQAGLGSLLICNFSVNELASNIARQRVFPAWIHDLVKALDSDEAPPKPLEVGDQVETELWQTELPDKTVIAPDGAGLLTTAEPDGNRFRLSFPTEQQGIYRLGTGQGLRAFAVNTPADESDLRAVDLNLLPTRLETNQSANFVEGSADFDALNGGRPVYQYFILGVLALLAAELLAQMLFKRLAA